MREFSNIWFHSKLAFFRYVFTWIQQFLWKSQKLFVPCKIEKRRTRAREHTKRLIFDYAPTMSPRGPGLSVYNRGRSPTFVGLILQTQFGTHRMDLFDRVLTLLYLLTYLPYLVASNSLIHIEYPYFENYHTKKRTLCICIWSFYILSQILVESLCLCYQ